MADIIQEPQVVLINKDSVQESLVLSILAEVTLNFRGFDFNVSKFRLSYVDNGSQEKVTQVLDLTIETIQEPNPNYDNTKPATGDNTPTIPVEQGSYIFTTDWLQNFYNNAFNGTSATMELEIFHLNAQLLQVVDNTIFVAFKDQPIITPIQGLLPLPFSNPFADIGIRTAVPQETPQGSDELSWKSGYTEPYQRPTNRDGKWIKMGQYNQILYDISKSALILQDNLSILADYITGDFDIKLNDIDDKVTEIATKPPVNAVLLTGNQSVAGLKNFTGVNINNFKNTPTAVANLEWCNGAPIQTANYWYSDNKRWVYSTTYTITQKSGMLNVGSTQQTMNVYINSKQITYQWNIVADSNTPSLNQGFPVRNKDTWRVVTATATTTNFNTYMGN